MGFAPLIIGANPGSRLIPVTAGKSAGNFVTRTSPLYSLLTLAKWGAMSKSRVRSSDLVISHLLLRKLVGLIGVLLPFVLLSGSWASSNTSLPGSVSGYYYTDMRSFLVAGLCALGVLLIAFRGYDTADGVLTDIAGFCVILVALCPTKPPVGPRHHLTSLQNVLGDLHVVFAAAAFIALGVMARRFAGTQWPEVVIHHACAGMIFSCVLLACLWSLLSGRVHANVPLLFAIEVLAMCASGVSWFISGRESRPVDSAPTMSCTAAIEITNVAVAVTSDNSLM
jgi:hypothetical protein